MIGAFDGKKLRRLLASAVLTGGPRQTVLGIGGDSLTLMAGPCSAESEELVEECAREVSRAGCRFLRGGAYKPRTSPREFQGVGEPALRWLRDSADRHGLKVVTEARDVSHLPAVAEVAHLIQIGSRNMQNFELLRLAGKTGVPVLLKRGLAATLEEFLLSAEYVLEGGSSVVLCERGIRGFEPWTRNTFDVGGMALLKHLSRWPVVADPSHGTGLREIVGQVALAAVAAGADGLIVETHPRPEESLTDREQAFPLSDLQELCVRAAYVRSTVRWSYLLP